MKTTRIRWLVLLLALLAYTGARGQSLWKSVSGAGYTASNNGVATMRGTFGQACIGNVSGGKSQTSLGFWNGNANTTSSVKPAALLPGDMTLLSTAPNPFRDETTIRFALAAQKDITLKIFADNGKPVLTRTLLQCPRGENTCRVPADNLPAGVYRYTLTDDKSSLTGEMTILR